MDCVNHSGVNASAYCQNCGKALCEGCVRKAAGGQILCEPCWTAWQSYQQPLVAAAFPSGPNPGVAAALGLIPGVGAMYNGQFFKAMVHVVIFAVLISLANHHWIFGLFIPAWILYQSFEAFHTAKARRDGLPLPDPMGLNELSSWLNPGGRASAAGPAGTAPGPMPPGAGTPYQATPSAYPPPPPYQAPYTTPPPAGGSAYSGVPPVPPIPHVPPPGCWQNRAPVGAVILIALGILFLLGQIDFLTSRIFEYSWPLLLIGLGAWLIVRRLKESQGGPQ